METEVQNADVRSKHAERWRLINNITGRKAAKREIIKGNSREERIKKWYEDFTSEGRVEEKLDKVLHNLQIDDTDFTIQEIQAVKKRICEGKQSGSDNIPPEVLKRCDLEDIIL